MIEDYDLTEDADDEGDDMDPSSASRAEQSRRNAKMRRDLELVEMTKLGELLPFSTDVTSKLDKGSILRLVIDYLKMRKVSETGHSDKGTQNCSGTPMVCNGTGTNGNSMCHQGTATINASNITA